MKSRLSQPDSNQTPQGEPKRVAGRRGNDSVDESDEPLSESTQPGSNVAAANISSAAVAVDPLADEDSYESPATSARPGGQKLVGSLLLLLVLGLGYFAWDEFFRFSAYGVVTGRVVQLSPAWSGVVAQVHVQPGDSVKQGETLVMLRSAEISQQIATLQDELLAARADLDAESARLALELHEQFDSTRQAWADYYLLQGDYGSAAAQLDEITNRLERYRELAKTDVVTSEEIVSLELEKKGKQTQADRYADALDEHRARTSASSEEVSVEKQLLPYLTKISTLTAQLQRLRDWQSEGAIKAPFDSKVIHVDKLVCEYCDKNEPIVELLQNNSTEVVVYVSQRQSKKMRVGQEATLRVTPYASNLNCVVSRLGNRIEQEVDLQHRYSKHTRTLPVYLKILGDNASASLPLGAQAQVVGLGGQVAAQLQADLLGTSAPDTEFASRSGMLDDATNQ